MCKEDVSVWPSVTSNTGLICPCQTAMVFIHSGLQHAACSLQENVECTLLVKLLFMSNYGCCFNFPSSTNHLFTAASSKVSRDCVSLDKTHNGTAGKFWHIRFSPPSQVMVPDVLAQLWAAVLQCQHQHLTAEEQPKLLAHTTTSGRFSCHCISI